MTHILRVRAAGNLHFGAFCMIAALLAISAHAQAPASSPLPLAYDVVVINPNTSGSGSVRISVRDATFLATNVSLKMLLTNAYNIRNSLISGLPGWAESARFDLNAKIVDFDSTRQLNTDQRRAMIATILADRFHLKVHPETRILPVYELVLAKDGPKLTPSPTPPPDKPDPTKLKNNFGPGSMNARPGELTANTVPLATLIANLESELDRTVIDKTGLTAKYDLHLRWTPDDATARPDNGLPADAPPPIFTALQEQLGLKLQPAKGPVVTLVVDHVDPPSAN